jgi:hypothetical protein
MFTTSLSRHFVLRFTNYGNLKFVPSFIIQIVGDTDRKKFHTVEPFIEGEFVKYSSNTGPLECTNETLQNFYDVANAFSHFSNWFSRSTFKKNLVVCDIQGVGLTWTDPQILSAHDKENDKWALGNLGQDALHEFMLDHKCNDICKRLMTTHSTLMKATKKKPQ